MLTPILMRFGVRSGQDATAYRAAGKGEACLAPTSTANPTACLYAVRSEYLQFPLAIDAAATMPYIQSGQETGSRAK